MTAPTTIDGAEMLTNQQIRDIATKHFWGGKCTTIDDLEKAILAALELLSASKPAAPLDTGASKTAAQPLAWMDPSDQDDATAFTRDANEAHCNPGMFSVALAASPAAPSADAQDERGAKACPFCGGAAEVHERNTDDGKPFYVQCDDCYIEVAYAGTREASLALWNTRAALQSTSHHTDAAAPAQSGEPIYQEWICSAWVDVDDVQYAGAQMDKRRIVYATPQPSQPVEAGEAKRFPTPISISTDKICEIAGKYNLGNPRLDALRCFVNEIIIVNEAEYAKSE